MWEALDSLPLATKIIISAAIVSLVIFSRIFYLTTKLLYIPDREQPKVIVTIKQLAVVIYIMTIIAVISFMVCLITIPIKGY